VTSQLGTGKPQTFFYSVTIINIAAPKLPKLMKLKDIAVFKIVKLADFFSVARLCKRITQIVALPLVVQQVFLNWAVLELNS
jgi:hypothetical protein